jgi:hypothetical protein
MEGATMTDRRADTELVRGVPPALTTEERGHEAPWALLAQPALGISGITYVGWSERDTARLIVSARAQGLGVEITRGASGAVSVRFTAPEEPAARAPAADGSLASDSHPGIWSRLWTNARRHAGLPGRRE